jgi:(2Fe-2S) ferredoxin
MKETKVPYQTLVLVCTNVRDPGARVSCAAAGRCGVALRDKLKAGVKSRGWDGRVRVSASGCLDLCEQGPTVLILRAGGAREAFGAVAESDVDSLLSRLTPSPTK